jgi:ribosomal protein S18 acetylase RimI-like enzyme
MTIAVETILLPPSAIDAAAAVQARAFFDDPLFAFVLPDERIRAERLRWLMRVGIVLGTQLGHVHTTLGDMVGHAVWLPPGHTDIADDRMSEAGFVDPEQRIGDLSLGRFGAFLEQATATHHRLLPHAHWYLLILGVDPPQQGRGLGGALLAPTLTRADAEGLPCYLETATERNVTFYRRHGFEVADEQVIDGGGPRVWSMIRAPRPLYIREPPAPSRA